MSSDRRKELEEIRRFIERGYEPFREKNRLIDNLRTRVRYYETCLEIAKKTVVPELHETSTLIEAIAELLSDAELVAPYDFRSVSDVRTIKESRTIDEV